MRNARRVKAASEKFSKNVQHRGSSKATNAFKAPDDNGLNMPVMLVVLFIVLVVGGSLVELFFTIKGE